MQLLTTNGTIREQLLDLYPANRRRLLNVFDWIADLVDSHAWLVFTAISLVCILIRFGSIATRHLDHDELYTFYIAQAPSISKVLTLTRTVDLHPPLSYLLVRLSFWIVGINTWACRVPSAMAFVLAAAFLFQLLKTSLSPIYGIIGVLFLWSGPFSYNAISARPYSLLLCFTSLMLLSWYSAISGSDRRRRYMLGGLAVAGVFLLLSHVLGALCFAAIAVAEGARTIYLRKLDRMLWIAFLAPMVACLTYLPLLKHRAILLFTPAYRPTPIRILSCYWEPLRYVVLPLALTLSFVVAHNWKRGNPASIKGRSRKMSPAILLALFGLYLVPLAVGFIFARNGTAFFDRYGVMMLIPAALAPPMLLAYGTGGNRGYATVVAAALGSLICLNSFGRSWLLEEVSAVAPPVVAGKLLYVATAPPVYELPKLPRVPNYLMQQLSTAEPVPRLDSYRPDLSLVTGTALTFMELDHTGNDAMTNRLFMLTNKEAASTIANDTLFENYEQLKAIFPIRGNIMSYCSFISNHRHFLILGSYSNPQGWLLRKLELDGAELTIVGFYSDTYDEHDLYEVTVPQSRCKSRP